MSDVADIPLEEEGQIADRLAQTREFPVQGPAPGSLEARIAERREKLEKKKTEVFDLPGLEGIVRVELRLLTGKRLFDIASALNRVHDDYEKALRMASESIVSSTVCFYIVDVDGQGQEVTERVETDWLHLAKRLDPTLMDGVPPRIGLLSVLSGVGHDDGVGVLTLAGEWNEWMRTRGARVEKEMKADF